MSRTEAKIPRKHLHETIEGLIWQGIRDGHLKPGQKVALVDEIVKKCDVSRATVQQSMQFLATKGLIVRRPRAGTFISNHALELVDGRRNNRSISLLVPDIQAVECASLARGVEDAALENNLSVIVSSTDNAPDRYEQVLLRAIESKAAGIFMVPPLGYTLSLSLLEQLQQSSIPIATCYRSLHEITGWPVIRTDAYGSMHIAATHMAQIGRRRIALIAFRTQPGTYFTEVDRLGYVMGLIENNVPVDISLQLLCGGMETYYDKTGISASQGERIQHQMEQFFVAHPQIDAICCGHDYLAIMAIRVLNQLNRRVPQDVAVIGRGNYAQYMGISPGDLTTVDGTKIEFGRHFCQMILAHRTDGKAEFPPVTEIPGRLVLGRSTDE